MSDETGKEAPTANNDEDTNVKQKAGVDAANGDDKSTTKELKKFSVKRVKFPPEPATDSDGSDDPSPADSPSKFTPNSPTTPEREQFTYGYATNEAIPMTMFYRSQHSQGHDAKQRPTLQELRKGLENDKVRKCLSLILSLKNYSCKLLLYNSLLRKVEVVSGIKSLDLHFPSTLLSENKTKLNSTTRKFLSTSHLNDHSLGFRLSAKS